jgi:hypothetical protein
MVNTAIETLDNGTPITDEVADKLVADVYAALESGAYRIIPNPHGKSKPQGLTNPLLQTELKATLDAH